MKIIIGLISLLLAGCPYYYPAPVAYTVTTPTNKFDQAWSAANGAFSDQGVLIHTQNRSAGIIQGTINQIEVTANIHTQADGSIKVQFNILGVIKNDPSLIQRITQSYNNRMGR